ncbi:lipopolysaccharide biosynthesis protein [Leuconostoc pseudomesenteroides]|uniref:lipopolysaccharide biosynthesis protein n=1 Tax=Leuconostoc pseudomesenteroides TaxID=33968 RepID=UPI0021AA3574|nr:lipopolysaccharide biosynthesis protein [Leuconostoc pseudomesenteroides]MCT4388517.1 lipopolysaccharide biosynthesis protein [Leuconostoc pseudomesenteroides]
MNQLIKKGLVYTFIGKFGNIFIMLLLDMILSRLLSPRVYGIVAILTVFIVFFQLLSDMGLGPAIIQNKLLSAYDIQLLFNFSIYVAISLAVVFGLMGIPLQQQYHIKNMPHYTWILSIAVFFYAAIIVPNAVLSKDKMFKIMNINSLLATTCGGVVGIVIALRGGGIYALLINTIVTSSILFFLNVSRSSLKFTFYLKASPIRKVFHFTVNQLGFNIVNYFSRNLDELLIGKYLTASDVGSYNKSYRLLMYPSSMLGGILNPVLLPIMSDYQDDVCAIKNLYIKVQGILSDFVFPLSVFLSFSARSIIIVLYGSQWINAIRPFEILSLSIWAQVLNITAGTIFQVRNMTSRLFMTGMISAGLIVTAIVLGILQYSIVSIAAYLTIAFILNTVIVLYMVMKSAFDDSLLPVLKKIYIPILVSSVLYILFTFSDRYLKVDNLILDIVIRFLTMSLFIFLSSMLNGNFKYLVRLLFKKN